MAGIGVQRVKQAECGIGAEGSRSGPGQQGSLAQQGSLGMFDFDGAGRLTPSLPSARLGMDFSWRGRPVSSSVRIVGDGPGGIITFRAPAGRMPSSAIAAAARPDAFELSRRLPALLPKGWSLLVGADHSVQIEAEIPVPMPALVSDLLVPAVQFCLAASPYFDLLEENAMGMRA